MRSLLIMALAFTMSIHAHSRPVSYTGGTTVMQRNNSESHSLHIHYSPSIRYSIGYKGEYWRDNKSQFHGVQFNVLAKRWNAPAAQANIYLKTGIGRVFSDQHALDNTHQNAAFTGIALDWENRRYFTAYENRGYYAGHIDKFFSQKIRLGIAPYIGDYGDLHTWLMLQVEHNPKHDDPITITPLVRLFKGVVLAELGIDENRKALLNLVIRY